MPYDAEELDGLCEDYFGGSDDIRDARSHAIRGLLQEIFGVVPQGRYFWSRTKWGCVGPGVVCKGALFRILNYAVTRRFVLILTHVGRWYRCLILQKRRQQKPIQEEYSSSHVARLKAFDYDVLWSSA